METNENKDTEEFFDPNSGISLEEQQDILDEINKMAAGKRLIGSEALSAKKKGIFFPLAVNVLAIIILGLGFFILSTLHNQDAEGIRLGSAALGLTERILIQEIRQETSRLLGEKDSEINTVVSRLNAADEEYRLLQLSVETMTEEQRQRAFYLQNSLEEYRISLAGLQNERARIIEDSLIQEAALRSRESQAERMELSLSLAMDELRNLSDEQDRLRRAEDQIRSFYLNINEHIDNNRINEAKNALQSMEDFLNAPSLRNIRNIETILQSHFTAIGILNNLLDASTGTFIEALPQQTLVVEVESAINRDLELRINSLEGIIVQQEAAIAAISGQGSDQERLIAEYLGENNSLREANINQQETLNRRDAEIVNLRAQVFQQEQESGNLNRTISSLNIQLESANSRISQNEASLALQVSAFNALEEEQAVLLESYRELETRHADLQQRLDSALRLFQGE